jgi:anionic cell wall polymer biosynthesis LytR-Cps2A-Psr (LCP) family protein
MKSLLKKAAIVLIILVILIGGFLAYTFQRFYSKTFVSQAGPQAASQPMISMDKPFNLLLLGYGGGSHSGTYLTDSMIVVHNNPDTKTLTLISLPRDMWVELPTNSTQSTHWKINAAYQIGLEDEDYPSKPTQFKGVAGAGNLTKYAVGEVTGLTIDRFVALDFSGFKKTIDSIGGVDINVETAFDDYQYPIDGKEDDLCGHQQSELPTLNRIAANSVTEAFPCRYEHLHYDKGLQHMDGAKALAYVRSRHSLQDGTDFGRSKRQRNLINAFQQKVLSVNAISSIIPLMNSLQDDFKTDMTLSEIQSLIPQLSNIKTYTTQNIALTNQNMLVDSTSSDGQAVLMPAEGQDQWNSIKTWLSASLQESPTQANVTKYSPIIKVENGSGIPGMGSLAANRLLDKDFNVLEPTDANFTYYPQTEIYTDGSNIDSHILDEIKSEFNISQISTKSLADDNANILIIVGNDYNLIQGKKIIDE